MITFETPTIVRHSKAVRVIFNVDGKTAVKFYDYTPGLPGYEVDDVLDRIKKDHEFLNQLGASKKIQMKSGQFDDGHNFIPDVL